MKKHIITWILCLLSLGSYVLLKIAPHFPSFVEVFYSRGINHLTTCILSHLTGLFPFSVAEIGLYLLVLYFPLHILYRMVKSFKTPRTWKHHLSKWFFQTLNVACLLWLMFTCGWTLNYSRIPLEVSLELEESTNPHQDLIELYRYLIAQLNSLRPEVAENAEGYMTIEGGYNSVFKRAPEVFSLLSEDYPIFKGSYGKPKSILASPLMNYTGLTGIYAPFTREANVNTATLPQSIPSTTLHEMAHQRGFAEEEACNFIAYLASTYARDTDFRYSGALLALAHTSQALAKVDYHALITLNQTIDKKVMKDILQNNAFWKSYEGNVEEVSTSLNNSYLMANGVTDGVASYGRMVDLLVRYYITFIKP
ncbi:MAG: DUF3810 domain-containing protein [Cellulosilyticum sp.]|nr:DUF3810 domain-containing protein [Cellulosilyticum sp.]